MLACVRHVPQKGQHTVIMEGLILTSNRGLRQDMEQMECRFDERVGGLESRVRDDMKQLGDRVGRLEHSQAHLGGSLEGLRDAISGRVSSS